MMNTLRNLSIDLIVISLICTTAAVLSVLYGLGLLAEYLLDRYRPLPPLHCSICNRVLFVNRAQRRYIRHKGQLICAYCWIKNMNMPSIIM